MNIDRSFLDEVFGDAEGYAHFAVGHGAYVDPADKYKFGDWEQFSFLWPQQADDVIRHLDDVLSQPDSNDLYVCAIEIIAVRPEDDDPKVTGHECRCGDLHEKATDDVDVIQLAPDKAVQLAHKIIRLATPLLNA